MARREVARCFGCKFMRPLKKDGAFMVHRRRKFTISKYAREYETCPGSGKKPEEADANDSSAP